MRKLSLLFVVGVIACGGPEDAEEAALLQNESALAQVAVGTKLKATETAKLRSTASWSASVLTVMPAGSEVVTLEVPKTGNDFVKVQYGKQVGHVVQASFAVAGSGPTPPAPPPPGTPSSLGAKIGTYELTFYWSALESNYTDAPSVKIYSGSKCALIATVSPGFFSELRMEGAGQLRDGRGLGYYGACSCPTSPCFTVLPASSPWGVGASGAPLVPFRSIAVDRTRLGLKNWYYAKELDGVTMPGTPPVGGFVHDGCLRADDTGSAIQGAHIDFMSGSKSWAYALLPKVGNSVTLYAAGTRCPAP